MREKTRFLACVLALAPVVLLIVFHGCGPSNEITGVPIANTLPDTWITGMPPVLDRTSIEVRFFWSGNDHDGDIAGFQWKISNNGRDGINVQDTLTVDPATGDTLNPWFFTQSTDSTFFVTADSSSFPPDENLPPLMQRFYQSHTFFVRAVDNRGQVDPSPASVTFTATTLAPIIGVSTPQLMLTNYHFAKSLPPTFVLGWTGVDPDALTRQPTKVRYLMKEAVLRRPGEPDLVINTEYRYNQHREELISFNDPGWSDWIPYAPFEVNRRVSYSLEPVPIGLPEKYYFFALQAQDTAGAVSIDLSYAYAVHNFSIDGSRSPLLTIDERFLDSSSSTGLYNIQRFDIAQNQPVEFNWYGNADEYGGVVEAYRYGWDVDDVTNDDDPGWQVEFGFTVAHLSAPTRVFDSGIHTLVVEVVDNSGQLTRARYVLTVVPIPEPSEMKPVLLIDDVPDAISNAWPNMSGQTKYDRDTHRDIFWSVALDAVENWVDDVDEIDTETSVPWGYREVVNYKVLLWTTRQAPGSYITQEFIGTSSQPKFIWLETYLKNVGNLFLVGSGATQNFYYNSRILYPVIFDTTEGSVPCGNAEYSLSFGSRVEDDGQVVVVGREKFPYNVLGISTSNLMVPAKFWIASNHCGDGGYHASFRCASTKAIILDPEFRFHHIGGTEFPDTIFTWATIDFQDSFDEIPAVNLNYSLGRRDEFYDYNTTTRPTVWLPQQLEDGTPVIEPMWRAYTRFDWIADRHLAQGDSDFPERLNLNSQTFCGSWTIDPFTGRSRNDGASVGVISHKTIDTKPGGRADMLWGFDPHRMDHDDVLIALRWVLGEHFDLDLE